jgi:hypothetical protein
LFSLSELFPHPFVKDPGRGDDEHEPS